MVPVASDVVVHLEAVKGDVLALEGGADGETSKTGPDDAKLLGRRHVCVRLCVSAEGLNRAGEERRGEEGRRPLKDAGTSAGRWRSLEGG